MGCVMFDAISRRFWRCLMILCLSVTALVSPSGRADALDGSDFFDLRLGPCVIYISTITDVEAYVFFVYSDAVAGGAYFSDGNIYFNHQAITAADISVCGITDVSHLVQTGASGDMATQSYMGFSFTGREDGVLYDYEYALVGATNTQVVSSRNVAPNDPPIVAEPADLIVASGADYRMEVTATDDDELSYIWRLVDTDGLEPQLVPGFSSPLMNMRAPVLAGGSENRRLVFEVDVSDGVNPAVVRDVAVTVNAPPVIYGYTNVSPVASGAVETLSVNATDASDTLAYTWTRIDTTGLPVTNETGAGTATYQFGAPVLAVGATARTLTYRVSVSDGVNPAVTQDISFLVVPPVNTAPTVDAGADATFRSGQNLPLSGNASDPDSGQTLTYTWTKNLASGTITGANQLTAAFADPDVSFGSPDLVYVLTLTVSDGVTSVSDSKTVTVTAKPNTLPTVNAGQDRIVTSGQLVTLDGRITDPDAGQTPSVFWSEQSFNAVRGLIANPFVVNATFTAPVLAYDADPMVLRFTLVSNDYAPDAANVTDDVQITVNPPVNTPPTADAGLDRRVGSGLTIGLEGSGSDADAIVSYLWTAPAGGGTFSNVASATSFYTAPKVAAGSPAREITLTLEVGDGYEKATSTMVVTVTPNAVPVVSAGADLTVVSGGQVSLNASATDADEADVAAMQYTWDAPEGLSFSFRSQSPMFTAPTLALNAPDAVFDLIVTGSDGTDSDSDAMQLTVTSKKNVAPVAAAQSSGAAVAGGAITLSAAGSTDADEGDVDSLEYVWTQTGGPGVLLMGSNTPEASFGLPTPLPTNAGGDLVFSVSVTDDDGASDTAEVVIELPDPPALVLTATASDDDVLSGDYVELNSTVTGADPESTLTYLWETDPDVMIDDPSQKDTYFYAPDLAASVEAEFVLTVTERNAKGDPIRTATSSVVVTIAPNAAPVIVVTGPTTAKEGDSVTLDASGSTDPEEREFGVYWVQTGGPTVIGRGQDQETTRLDILDDVKPIYAASKGPVLTFTAPTVPEGEAEVVLTFEARASDGNAASARAWTVTVTRAGVVEPEPEEPGTDDDEREKLIAETEAQVDQFVQTRMNNLIGTQPDLGSVFSGGDGTANVTVSSMGGQVDLATAPDQPVWLRLKGNWSTIGGAEGDYVLGAAGTHVLVGEGLALGIMAQVDHLRTVDGLAVAEGTGYLIGPYVVAKLPDQPLVVQGRLLYGASQNTFSPLGTFEDSFDATRLLAQLGVSGQIAKGDVVWKPSLQAAYAREQTDAYTDGAGNPIGAGDNAVAQVAVGVEVTFAVPVPSGAMTATLGLSDIWAGSVSGGPAAYEGHRGKVSFGVNRAFGSGAELSLTGSYDGLGADGYESLGLDLVFQHKF